MHPRRTFSLHASIRPLVERLEERSSPTDVGLTGLTLWALGQGLKQDFPTVSAVRPGRIPPPHRS